MKRDSCLLIATIIVALLLLMNGCAMAPKIAKPNELVAPKPIYGNSGKYMCPYTQDGVLAEWTDMAINAKTGAVIGKTAGAYIGQKVCEQIPFIGGMLGSTVGDTAGREIAVGASGGWEKIKSTSDLSFNNVKDMSVYLYVKHSSHEHYNDAIQATFSIYPEFQKQYYSSLVKTTREQVSN